MVSEERKNTRTKRSAAARTARKSLTFHFETKCWKWQPSENKREVKTGSFSPPGVGGVLHDKSLAGPTGLPSQPGLRPPSRTPVCNSLGDSPPKSLSFRKF